METHIEGKMYGYSLIEYDVWVLVYRKQCMETHIQNTTHRESYRGYKVWMLI